MNDSFSKTIKGRKIIQTLPERCIVSKNDWDEYYRHFTISVRSLAEFVDVISRIETIRRTTSFAPLIFRGHSDASSSYKIIPTIGRINRSIEYIENLMVNEMINLRPDEFDNIKCDFDLLSKLQHYGLPTRILDFTFNPLIGLYFACCEEKRTDGRVLCTYDTSTESTRKIIERICGLYHYDDYNAISLDRVLGNASEIRKYAIHTRYPLIAKPKYSNERIKHQLAVFMVFPNAIYDYRSMMVFEGRKHGNEDEYRRFTITPEEEKRLEYIRKEPNVYKNGYYLDADSMNKLMKYYNQQFDDFENHPEYGISNKYHFIFNNRFSIIDEIQELSDEIIANCFISILIESKYRKKIMQDLSTIGIDKAFVFPELEYTTELVKNWYFSSGIIH